MKRNKSSAVVTGKVRQIRSGSRLFIVVATPKCTIELPRAEMKDIGVRFIAGLGFGIHNDQIKCYQIAAFLITPPWLAFLDVPVGSSSELVSRSVPLFHLKIVSFPRC